MAERAMSRAGKAAKASHSPSPSHEGSYFPDPAQSGWQPESAPSGMPRILVRLLKSPPVTRWTAWPGACGCVVDADWVPRHDDVLWVRQGLCSAPWRLRRVQGASQPGSLCVLEGRLARPIPPCVLAGMLPPQPQDATARLCQRVHVLELASHV